MKKIITTVLLAGSFMGIFGATALLSEESQSEIIKQKAKVIVQEAKVEADKLVDNAKAKKDATTLKKESAESMKETKEETRTLAEEALQKAKAKGQELAEKTKAVPQVTKQGMEDKCVYTKEAVNKSYEKKAKMPLRIHEFMLLSNMHF